MTTDITLAKEAEHRAWVDYASTKHAAQLAAEIELHALAARADYASALRVFDDAKAAFMTAESSLTAASTTAAEIHTKAAATAHAAAAEQWQRWVAARAVWIATCEAQQKGEEA